MDSEKNILSEHMGEQFTRLAPLLQRFHRQTTTLQGSIQVIGGKVFARLICYLFGLPKSAKNVELKVCCEHKADFMHWRRDFSGFTMNSRYYRDGDHIVEHLHFLKLWFKAIEREGKLHYLFSRFSWMGIPAPRWFQPQIDAYEEDRDGRYFFYVKVTLPLIGLLISYGGSLLLLEQEI